MTSESKRILFMKSDPIKCEKFTSLWLFAYKFCIFFRFEFAKKSGRVEPKNEKDSQIHIQNKFATLSSNQ